MERIDAPRILRASWDGDQPSVVAHPLDSHNEQVVQSETSRPLGRLLNELQDQGMIASVGALYDVDMGHCGGTSALHETPSRTKRDHHDPLPCELSSVSGDSLISLDTDLHDELSTVPGMMRVFCDTDGVFKRLTATRNDKALAAMNVDEGLPPRALRTSIVVLDRADRFACESQHLLRKLPSLRVVASSINMAFGLFTNVAMPCRASTVIPKYLLGGVQLLSLDVIGEVAAKVYAAGKQRPLVRGEPIIGYFG